MDKQAEALRLAGALLEDIELQRLKPSEVVLKASRLARLVGHDDLQEFLSLEREGYETRQPDKWITKAGRWANDEHDKLYTIPLTRVESMRESARQAMDAMRGGGNFSGDMVLLASREHDQKINSNADLYARLDAVCGQVVATVYDMVVEIYHELLFSELQATLFAQAQGDIDGTLAEAGGSVLDKIEKVSARLRDGDPESVSQALTTCRRLIDACADHVFPGQDAVYELSSGVELKVAANHNVLNRLQAYVDSLGVPKGRRDRIRRSLSDLYERCSAGTHSEVSVQEARFVFLQTYIVLGEVLTLIAEVE